MLKGALSKAALVLAAALLTSSPAEAWDGADFGKITEVDMTGGNNFDVRVTLAGQSMCGDGTPTWAYLKHSYDNYQAIVSLVLTAWTTNKDVLIYTTKDGLGYCEIGYVVVH